MAGTVIADNLQAAATSQLVIKNGVASTPPTIQDSAGTTIGTFCRAWVNFNGIGTVAIRASFNVSSITDNGTGDYTVNFTTALTDANYAAIAVASGQYGSNMGGQIGMFTNATVSGGAETAPTTAATRFVFNNYSSNNYDAKYVSFAVFR
jgi:hypothetical protein